MPAEQNKSLAIVVYGVGDGMTAAKRRLVQQQLVLLLHAHKCNRRYQAARESGEDYECTLRNCKLMKGVLRHLPLCEKDVRACRFPHCSSSKQILNHWKNCVSHLCLVCKPLKMAERVPRHNPFPNRSSNGCA